MSGGEWQNIHAIHMSIQSADLHHIGVNTDKELSISCGLINIARGQCNLRICPSKAENNKKSIGNLHISADRPVMTAEIGMPVNIFDEINSKLTLQFSRPGTIILLLAEELFVNIAGDLKIDTAKNIKIRDISWIFPVQ
mgnify:CR=1 FL=1